MTEEREETEAQRLQRLYRRPDGWHATNNAQIGRGTIDNYENLVKKSLDWMDLRKTASEKLRLAQREVQEAQRKHSVAEADLEKIETNLHIVKLAIVEALEVGE